MFKLFDMRNVHTYGIPDEWAGLSQVFTALGDEHRQRILLGFQPGERLNVSQIARASTLSRPAVSHHLHVLREAGVLRSEKLGREIFYWIDKALLEQTLTVVLEYVREQA